MNKYTELSDFEINKKVTSHYLPCDYNINEHTKTIELIGFLGDTDEYNVYGTFDPCNNPTDAMPIITESGFSMVRVNNTWSARQFNNHCIEINGDDYCRIAMICFLLMKDAENSNGN